MIKYDIISYDKKDLKYWSLPYLPRGIDGEAGIEKIIKKTKQNETEQKEPTRKTIFLFETEAILWGTCALWWRIHHSMKARKWQCRPLYWVCRIVYDTEYYTMILTFLLKQTQATAIATVVLADTKDTYPTLTYPVIPYPTRSYPIIPYPFLSYPILPYPVLTYPIV